MEKPSKLDEYEGVKENASVPSKETASRVIMAEQPYNFSLLHPSLQQL
jgi:hypothetical protein